MSFLGARFHEDASFRNSTFTSETIFDHAWFRGAVDFTEVTFLLDTAFHDVDFNGTALFDRSGFAGAVNLDRSVARQSISFTNATFDTATRLGPLVARAVDLTGAVFKHRVAAKLTTLELFCGHTRFDDGVELQVRHAYVALRHTHFGAASTVAGAATWFRDTLFADLALRQSTKPSTRCSEVISLQSTDVSELMLADVSLEHCLFAGAHHLDKLRLEGQTPFNRPPDGWYRGRVFPYVWRWSTRRVLEEEHHWRGNQPKRDGWQPQRRRLWVGEEQEVRPRPEEYVQSDRLEVLYRSLRKALEDGKNEPGAGDFYYGEMEARRHSRSTRRAERALLTAYWAISGYGQRAGRTIAALLVLIGVLSAVLVGFGLPAASAVQHMTGTIQPAARTGGHQQIDLDVIISPALLPPAGERWNADRVGKAVRIAAGSVVFRDTDQRLTTTGQWALMAGRAFGPVLIALAALAIRARVKR